MKKTIILLAVLFYSGGMFAQDYKDKSLFEKVTNIEKKTDKMNVHIDFAGSARSERDVRTKVWNNSLGTRHFRINVQGRLTDKLSYRFRQVINRLPKMDDSKFTTCTDFMFLAYDFNEKFFGTVGKVAQQWGGYEFDANPVHIYDYSDFIGSGNTVGFVAGVNFGMHLSPGNDLIFQVTNSRDRSFESEMKRYAASDIDFTHRDSNAPFTYTLAWNGSLLDGRLHTRWGGGLIQELDNKCGYFIGLGERLDLGRFQITTDYMIEKDDLDHFGIASGERGLSQLKSITNTKYVGKDIMSGAVYDALLAKFDYQPADGWNLWFKGGYETGSVEDVKEFKDYRKSYMYGGGIEYYPSTPQEIRIFAAYMGKHTDFSDECKIKDFNRNRVEVGFMCRLNIF